MNKEDLLILKKIIISELSELKEVNKIATFGSLAKGTFDNYSDIDIIVSVSSGSIDLKDTTIVKNCLFYRPFSSGNFPSGRYWIDGYSVFNKIDISFHSPDDFENLIIHGNEKIYVTPPFCVEYICKNHSNSIEIQLKQRIEYNCTEIENRISAWVYHILSAIKACHRNQNYKYNIAHCKTEIQNLWEPNRNIAWRGGNLNKLVCEVLKHAKI